MGLSMVSKVLFDRIEKLCNIPLIYTDKPNLKGLDVAIIYAVPYHNRSKMIPGVLDSDTKLISYFGDLQCHYNRECEKNKKLMFERCDIIMGGFYEKFVKWYPQYLSKYKLFSGCFYPYESYADLQVNLKPKMKCLISGHVNYYYPFRKYIKELWKENVNGISELVDIKGRAAVPFEEYPKFLNNYFCAIATSGMFGGIVSKYFEIPAAGTLLLAERKEELDILGFEPNIHYIPITRKNVIRQIKEVLNHPENYTKMRENAMKFVQENHSDINRSLQFKDIVGRLIDEE